MELRHFSPRVKRPVRDAEHSPTRNVLLLHIRMLSLREHGQPHPDLTPLKCLYGPDSYHIDLKVFSMDQFNFNEAHLKMFI